MCSIFGFTGQGDRENLAKMAATQTHRGPDGEGFHVEPDLSIGMRRLAIVDIEKGQQPVFSPDRDVIAVLNGEIYNHIELRRTLEADGCRFRSDHSDSEVIPFLYQKHGPDFVRLLNGMFAIALWDRKTRTLHLFRDHSGIKPLYFTSGGGRLAFASEIKALLALPHISRSPDLVSLSHYFTYRNVVSPRTAFTGIEQLLPGEHLSFSGTAPLRRKWWSLEAKEDPSISLQDASVEIRRLLSDSVRLQLRSDVPVGFYLSGGVDSSAVVALAARLGVRGLKTFTLTFEGAAAGKEMDRRCARLMVERYQTEHHELELRRSEVPAQLDAIVRAFDEPFSGTVSTYFLSGLIRKHVTVALSGDGADELFGSYQAHRLARPLALLAADPEHGNEIYAREGLQVYGFTLERLQQLLAAGGESARRLSLLLWNRSEKAELLSADFNQAVGGDASQSYMDTLYASCPSPDPINRALYADSQSLLPDQVLPFVDRLSMQHSIEVRPPFLDHRLVEYAFRLPGDYKINRQGRVKHVLKEAVKDLLPAEILDRPKEGFVVPTHWILDGNRDFIEARLSSAALGRHGLLNPGFVQNAVRRYFGGETQLGYRLWNLVMFQMWWEAYIA